MDKIAFIVDAGYFWIQAAKVLYSERKPRSYVFVDYQKMLVNLNAIVLREFPDCRLLRVYWYDAPCENGEECHSHSEIKRTDNFKLRMGTRNKTGAQKAVDGLIIADLIGLAQNRAISDAVIISGDADLVPGVIVAQNLGIKVSRLEIGSKEASSPDLAIEVDRNLRWDTVREFISPPDEASPPAQNIAIKDILNLSETAENFCQNNKEYSTAIANLDNNLIPNEIDSKLLAFAKTIKKDTLTDSERKQLRSNVKNIAKKLHLQVH